MSDFYQLLIWIGILGFGVAFCLATKRLGLKTKYVRDFLHVGTGLWVFGLKFWQGKAVPIAVVGFAFILVVFLPSIMKKVRSFEEFHKAVSDDEELWSGIVMYVFSYFAFTAIGLYIDVFAAACALGILSVGDGLGGLIGSTFGKAGYTLPWSKKKTWLGSFTVAAGAFIAILIITWWYQESYLYCKFAILSISCAIVEGLSPRATDNITIPCTAFLLMKII